MVKICKQGYPHKKRRVLGNIRVIHEVIHIIHKKRDVERKKGRRWETNACFVRLY